MCKVKEIFRNVLGRQHKKELYKTERKILRAGKLSPLFHEVIVTTLI